MASAGGYDVIVRAETCSSYPNLNIVDEDALSIPYWHHVYNLGNYNTVNLNNWVAFGPPYIMDYYCSAFLKLRKYYSECLVHPVESIINYHLMQRPNMNLRLFFSRIFRKGVLNWNGGKYNQKEILSEPWLTNVNNVLGGQDDKAHADKYYKGEDTFNTSLQFKQNLDLHSMSSPVDIKKPDDPDCKESSYHTVHKFNSRSKALNDFDKPYQDEDGNWTTQENWMYDEVIAEKDHKTALSKIK